VAVRKRGVEETRLRLYWAWNGGDGWKAATDPRSQFSRSRYPVLHKLYVLRDLSGYAAQASEAGKAGGRDEVCEAFLAAFLPELDSTQFNTTP
jgi:hypothetical protein